MSNRLSMAKIQSIETLKASGHSNREISRLLGIDRGTVNEYVRRLKSAPGVQNRPNPQIGADAQSGSVPHRPDPQTESDGPTDSFQNRPDPRTGFGVLATAVAAPVPVSSGPASLCEAYRQEIEEHLERGLSIRRIHQELIAAHGFSGSYHSVRRLVLSLGKQRPLPFRRMEVEPGEEAQIDFGMAAPVIDVAGKMRRETSSVNTATRFWWDRREWEKAIWCKASAGN